MGKRVSLAEVQYRQIVILQKPSLTEHRLSQQLDVGRHQCTKQLSNSKMWGNLWISRRRRKTTPRDDHVLHPIAVRSPVISCKKIRVYNECLNSKPPDPNLGMNDLALATVSRSALTSSSQKWLYRSISSFSTCW